MIKIAEQKFQKENYSRQWDYKSFGNMGTNLNPFQGNQLQQLNQFISAGAGSSEIITLDRRVWEGIPKQHFEEMRRLGTLTGVEPTVHAPIIEPIGFLQIGQQRQGWSEEARKSEERFVEEIVDRAATLADPRHPRNVPINIHPDSTGHAPVWRKAEKTIKDSTGYEIKKGDEYKEVEWFVDRMSGNPVPLKFEVKYEPPKKPGETEHVKIWTPERRLAEESKKMWMNEVASGIGAARLETKRIKQIYQEESGKLPPEIKTLVEKYEEDAKQKIGTIFEDLRKNCDLEDEGWSKLSEERKKELETYRNKYLDMKKNAFDEHAAVLRHREEVKGKLERASGEERDALVAMEKQLAEKENMVWEKFFNDLKDKADLADKKPEFASFIPRRFVPFEEFAREKSADTYAEAAMYSLKVGKEKAEKAAKDGIAVNPLDIAPLINIENMPANQLAFGRAEELKKLIDESRRRMADKLVQQGMGKGEAQKISERIIGATWDVGHINMLRMSGYNTKDIIDEVKKIAPYVRHFHVTDNFGTTDSHMIPGQGTAVPLEQVRAIKEEAARLGKPLSPNTKEIMEIGGFVEHHKTSPWPFTLEAYGSPIYEMEAGPSWSEKATDLGSNYFFGSSEYVAGAGNILPEAHFGMYGSGFSGLPTSFGAPIAQGERSRFSGTPMS